MLGLFSKLEGTSLHHYGPGQNDIFTSFTSLCRGRFTMKLSKFKVQGPHWPERLPRPREGS